MSIWFWITTLVFIVVSASMVLIILVQRPQGGGLAGAFGGAGGAGTETVFGGRVGDALTWATVTAFVLYLRDSAARGPGRDRPAGHDAGDPRRHDDGNRRAQPTGRQHGGTVS
ncbi:MAG: preprotein translocase subunit SecG [Planctomycetota bacterium]|jgi:protein translocase SecG subunit